MHILVDHCVIQDSVISEDRAFYPQGYEPFKNNFLEIKRVKKPERKDWRQKEKDCLKKLADLCRANKITFYTSPELKSEHFRVLKFPSQQTQSYFDGLKFHKTQSPLDRSKWGIDLQQYSSKEHIISHCKCFFFGTEKRTNKFIEGMKKNPRFSLSDFEEISLRKSSDFQQICFGLSETHYPDALHYWTAELNGLDCFMTIDKAFINVIRRKNLNFHCQILFPSEVSAMFQ